MLYFLNLDAASPVDGMEDLTDSLANPLAQLPNVQREAIMSCKEQVIYSANYMLNL